MDAVPAHKNLYGLIKQKHSGLLRDVEKEFDNYAADKDEFTGYHISKFLLEKWKTENNLTWEITTEKESGSVLGYAVFQYFGNKPGWQTTREVVANNDMRVYRRIADQDSASKGPEAIPEQPQDGVKPGGIPGPVPTVSASTNKIPPS